MGEPNSVVACLAWAGVVGDRSAAGGRRRKRQEAGPQSAAGCSAGVARRDVPGEETGIANRERTRHAANGAEDGHLRAGAAGAEPRQSRWRLEAAAAGRHSAQDGVRGGDGSAAGCRRQGWQDAFWQPLAAAPLAARCGPQRRGCPRFRYGGGGSRGRGECRIAGGGEGEGGETMPDAETSPLPSDEPPAENSIEG